MMRHADVVLFAVTQSLLVYYGMAHQGTTYFWLTIPMSGVWLASIVLCGAPARWCTPITSRRDIYITVGSAVWHALLTILLTLHIVLVGVDPVLYPQAIASLCTGYRVTVPQICRAVCHAARLPLPHI